MIDLHLHLLPGVDDGARTVEDALAMAKALTSLGFHTLAPSPHHRREYASLDRALCESLLVSVGETLVGAGLQVTLESNAENHFLEDFFPGEVAGRTCRTIGRGQYVLVEAPHHQPLPALADLVFRMKLKGYTPLIAHPERCLEFERKGRAAELVAAGARLQLDVGALIGRYGKTAQTLARQFLHDGLYAVAATDLHGPARAAEWVGESLEALERIGGAGASKTLFQVNPASILAGDPV